LTRAIALYLAHASGYAREFFVSQTPELTQMADVVIDLVALTKREAGRVPCRRSLTTTISKHDVDVAFLLSRKRARRALHRDALQALRGLPGAPTERLRQVDRRSSG